MTSAHRPEAHGGELGWALLACGIFAWDRLAPETLSNAYRRAKEKHPVLAIGALAIVAAHLIDKIPERYDPLAQGFGLK